MINKTTHKKPELIAPAGDWASLSSALDAGADAVYFGVKGLNMRRAAGNFDVLEVPKVMERLRASGRKGYLALNVMLYGFELDKTRRVLEEAAGAGVDAVILWDMAALSMAREMGLRIHLSTQAGVSNTGALRAYASLGVKRVVLARECSLDGIRKIARAAEEEGIDCGIETFIHGAMCVSVSGRCFLSQYSFGRSANRGDCLQPCRREYAIRETDPEGEGEYVLGEDYILSPRDLCTVTFIDDLMGSGIEAFKIEGRMRPPEYVANTVSAYKEAMDACCEGRLNDDLKRALLDRLKGSFNRGFSDGFYFGVPRDIGGRAEAGYEKVYLGEVVKYYGKIGVAEISVTCGDLEKGQKLLVTGKATPASFFEAEEMEIDHEPVDVAEKGMSVGVKVPFTVRPKDKVFLWDKKA